MTEKVQNNKNTKQNGEIAKDLLISFKFPPSSDVSGIVLAKRAIITNKLFDVIHGPINKTDIDNDINNEINKIIDKRMIIDEIKENTKWSSIKEFKNRGLEEIESTIVNKNIDYYATITSRAWLLESHFLALEYKLKHPQTQWIAEFSDPLRVNIENKNRFEGNESELANDKEFIKRINLAIDEINNKEINSAKDKTNKKSNSQIKKIKLPNISQNSDIFFLGEYLPYIFADKIRFTNKNQQKIMLDIFPYEEINLKEINEFKEYITNKSEIKRHPTLSKKFYTLKESDYPLSENTINLGYFGSYLGKRHLEYIYYALTNLNKELTDKKEIKLHYFVSNPEYLNKITHNLEIAKNISAGPQLPLLEFLNLTKKLDVLIVNDTSTKDYFKINPYLPSKLADYLGGNKDIWGICEKGSIMSNMDLKYKSYIDDYESSLKVLNQIIKDKLEIKNNKTRNKESNISDNQYKKQNSYLKKRITDLNNIIEEFTYIENIKNNEVQRLIEENNRLNKENHKLKEKNIEVLNSNSWKITKNFRKIGNKIKK